MAGEAGRLNVVNWGPAPGAPDFWRQIFGNPNIVWVALLNGFIGSMAAFGTDQDLMQRLLTVETRGQSQRTLSITPLGTALTLAIYLGLGAALFTYYAQHPALPVSRPDAILPHFVQQAMPAVLRGLMLSAIVLASIDSPLGALASSFVTDIYRPLLARGRSEGHYLRGVEGERGGLRGAAGRAGLRLLVLRGDPLAGLQDRGRDVRVPPGRLSPRPGDAARGSPTAPTSRPWW